MHDLAKLQSEISRAILSGDSSPLAGAIVAPVADPLRRLGIYRNNTFLSLIRHLKTVFPVTARLSDERFFSYAGFEFVRAQPPREPRLSVFGSGFPAFLSRFAACRAAPILPALASLEWAVHSALSLPVATALPPTALAHTDQSSLRLVLQPSLHLVLSRWPLLPLLAGTHPDGKPLLRRTTYTAVMRKGDSIRFMDLSSDRYVFWRTILRGARLDHAAARALARNPMFNLVDEILALFGADLVTATEYSHAH